MTSSAFNIPGWRFYNHAAIPTTAPHEEPDLTPIKDGSIWCIDGQKPLFACYTTNWNCSNNTGWWYIIKDTPFDIMALKTKRRYEITKARRFFDVREIKPTDFANELSEVQEKSFTAYPKKYRPIFIKKDFTQDLFNLDIQVERKEILFWGAFFKETGKLCGYSYIKCNDRHYDLSVLKTIPDYEKFNVNAALMDGVLNAVQEQLQQGFYICDGSRAINHETHFQDYLEKYFGFRKVFCRLNVVYTPICKYVVAFMFPFRGLIKKIGTCCSLFHKFSALLKMEEIQRMGRNL